MLKLWRNPFALNKHIQEMCFRAVDVCFDPELPDYVQDECGGQTGGMPFIAFLKPDVVIDLDNLTATLESASWWNTNINGSPSSVYVALNTRGSKAKGTPTENPGFGFNSVVRSGVDRTAEFEALGAVENERFWSGMNKKTSMYFIYGTTTKDSDGDYVAYLASNASINADVVIDQDIKSLLRIGGDAKWSTDGTLDKVFSFPAAVITALS